MTIPYIAKQVVFNEAEATGTKALDSEFERCQIVVIEFTTTGFSGTIDIQGKMHELATFSNVPYIRQDVHTLQTPAVAQLSYSTDTGVYRYVILGWWRKLQIVMTRTAGSITLAAVGSSQAHLFPRVIQT